MKKFIKKILRLFVMIMLSHDESYYQTALKSKGLDYLDLTHTQIAVWKSVLKQIEADIIISTAFNNEFTNISDVDISPLIPKE